MSKTSLQAIFLDRMASDHGPALKNAPAARKAVSACDVPPWRYLRPGLPIELAALLAADELHLDAAGRLTLLWKLRMIQTQYKEYQHDIC